MKIRSWCSTALVLAALSLSAAPLEARTPLGDGRTLRPLPENWEARLLLRDTIFAPVRDAAEAPRRIIAQTEYPGDVSFRVDVQEGAVFLVFANRSSRGFPLDGAGTFIIKRSLKDGSFLQAKVFVQNDPGTFLRLFPQGDRTVMDIVLYNVEFQSGVVLPIRFENLLTSPFARIVDLSESSVNWRLVLSPEQGPGDVQVAAVVDALRRRLSGLRDMDDGAMDASGRLVFIATGEAAPPGRGGFNCSGFAKWVVDGFYAPLSGSSHRHRGAQIERLGPARHGVERPLRGGAGPVFRARLDARPRPGACPGANGGDACPRFARRPRL